MSGDDGGCERADEGVPGEEADGLEGEPCEGWPVSLAGVTESLVATRGPNGLWNVAALGLFAGEAVTARTWGNTRTQRNFHREGEGYVQFTRDPVAFADAALSIVEEAEPVIDATDAWARVRAERAGSGTDGGTRWVEWTLVPVEAAIERETVVPINRGFGAVIEATVAASRLDVPGYDETVLVDRLAHCVSVVDRTGGPRELEALSRVRRHSTWEPAAADEHDWL
ncbi:DUF447 domain-containing protein [Saliphagus sp. LR7]|uniref:DUF447 domain-containing protein n=1 Tax=Saliphagus sp. LR7 TaxID=2282654 RepID=UPI000DF7A1BB|nr:DUF447 domain-containing protein [Saliphagus sp. LR7]